LNSSRISRANDLRAHGARLKKMAVSQNSGFLLNDQAL
jgi:hypothetical protein